MVFPVLQIRRPALAAVCFGLYVAVGMALLAAAMGRPVGDVLFELPVSVITATVVGAVVNKRTRPEGLAGLTAEQIRRVVRWVRRGEAVDDRAVAEAVIVYARHQDRIEPWATACFSLVTVAAFSLMVTGDGGVGSAPLRFTLLAGCVVFFVDQRLARRRRRAAEAAARSRLRAP